MAVERAPLSDRRGRWVELRPWRCTAVGVAAASLALTAAAEAQPEAQPEASPSADTAPLTTPPPAEPEADEPDALFRQGLEQYRAGQFAEAAALWEQLRERLGPERGWKLLYNLGLAYERQGDATQAVERFQAFLSQVATQAGALPAEYEQRREDAALRILGLKQSHGAVVLPPAVGPVRVSVNDAAPREAGFTAYVRPGDHRVSIIGSADATRTEWIVAVAGQSLELDTRDPALDLAARPPAGGRGSAEGDEPQAEPAEFPTTIVLIGVGLTAASIALPTALWYYAADEREEADQLGRGHTGYAGALEDFESARTAYELSYLLPAALGAATLGVAIWGLVEAGSDSGSAIPVETAAAVTSEGGRLWLQARF